MLLFLGIERDGCKTGIPAKFTVETFGAGNGEVAVNLEYPDGRIEKIKPVPNNDKLATYSVTYHPKTAGVYQVSS